MKRNKSIFVIALATLFGGIVAFTSSLAWMNITATMEKTHNPIEGTVEDAYYASGTGTALDPFIITRPRHLYNLAWLQFLGYYNKTNDHQYYFELGDNLDMSDYCAIPPIGSEKNPFVGNFNGKGYVISGVTISNNFEDFISHPSVISSWDNADRKQPHILGLFGIIGDYTNGNKPSNYSSEKNEFINTGITGATIKSTVTDCLAGIAAGYVNDTVLTDTHYVLKNIIVDNSNLSLPTTGTTSSYGGKTNNISDYTLVGYTNNTSGVVRATKSMYGINVDTNYTFNASEDGNDTGWGGSIDMMSVTKRLQRIRDSVNRSDFEYHSRYTTYEGGNTTHNAVGTDTSYTKLVNSDDEIGHFNFITGTSTVNERYALLGGGHWQENINYNYVSHSAFQITDGTQYMKVTSTTIDKTTTQSEGSYWAFDANQKLYTKSGTTYYYLRNNSGTLQATTTANNGSAWTIDDTGNNRLICSTAGNNRYTITYSNNSFRLVTGTATGNTIAPYSIRYKNENNYMTYSGTELVNSTSEVKIWYFSSMSNNTQIYTIINGENYYLNPNNVNNNEYMNLSKTTQTNWTWGTSGNYKTLTVAHAGNNTYRRLSYYPSDDEWYLSAKTNYNSLTITGTPEYSFTSTLTKTAYNGTIIGPDYGNAVTVSKMNYEGDDVTYFPLSTNNDTDDFAPKDSNTAYVVGGSRLTANTTTYDDNLTNVRFGYYPIQDNISADYNKTTGQFTNVYTINNNSKVKITDDSQYEKLIDAKKTLGGIMKGQTNVYGLHFMQSEISMDAITTASYVKVNGVEQEDYELPVNCIDFHLKEFGYINFLSGSYYPGNNSFFSLYQIERNPANHATAPNKITGIYEVKNVYQHKDKYINYSYVYELYDGTNTFYTKPYKLLSSDGDKEWIYDTENPWAENQYINSLPTDYRLVFNVANIKSNTVNDFENHVYYFEIPMNDGEFCLGSVAGADGAYLMYLDIGANAAKTTRTIAYEKFSLAEKTYLYPVGVALQTLPQTYTSGQATININTTIDESDSACMVVKATANGTYNIDRDAGDVTLTRTNATLAPPIYAGSDITLVHEKNSSTNIEIAPVTSYSYDVRRMQYFDYLVNTDTLSVTTFTDYSTDGGETFTRVIEQSRYTGTSNAGTPTSTYVYDPRGETPVDQRNDMKIYNTTSGIKYSVDEIINTSTLPIAEGKLPDTVILEFSFLQEGGSSYDESSKLIMVVDTSISQTETYYKFGNYTIVFTPESGSITIKVLDYESSFTVTVYNNGTSQSTDVNAVTVITINGTTITGTIGQTITIP